MLPIAESAFSEFLAAVILAKVSGSEVPKATNVIAVTDSSIPRTHPRTVAISPTTNVTRPIKEREITNDAAPFQTEAGGIKANNTFQPIATKWNKASYRSISYSIISSSSSVGPSITAFLNC